MMNSSNDFFAGHFKNERRKKTLTLIITVQLKMMEHWFCACQSDKKETRNENLSDRFICHVKNEKLLMAWLVLNELKIWKSNT